ncbi:hypothetical protein CSUI_008759 [Cystoisospora suis]|uniref:Uncharacterized protein n=1 Tax=Cystoisospora suis TaxID=483139 RepID=A0A2C6KIM9_9APIC|nr:hypothetical protein CSUI_008759 [Cystoisospora suis]
MRCKTDGFLCFCFGESVAIVRSGIEGIQRISGLRETFSMSFLKKERKMKGHRKEEEATSVWIEHLRAWRCLAKKDEDEATRVCVSRKT